MSRFLGIWDSRGGDRREPEKASSPPVSSRTRSKTSAQRGLEEQNERINDDGEDLEVENVEYHEDTPLKLAAVGRNDPSVLGIYLVLPYTRPMSPKDWISSGQMIGRNIHLKRLSATLDWLFEDQDDDCIATDQENAEGFITGISKNRSIKFLKLVHFNFRRARLDFLHPFVVDNGNLADLRLRECQLNRHDVQMLANAFGRRRNPASIKYIAITGEGINDDSVQAIVELSDYCPQLIYLELSCSSIGDRGCKGLAALLENPRSNLKHLILNYNPFGDEGAQVLANAIADNKRLEQLAVDGCRAMSPRGWGAFFQVVCDPSSVSATYRSNHTLCKMWELFSPSIPPELRTALQGNEENNKIIAARKKILHFCMNGNFDVSQFMAIDAAVLPCLLAQIGGSGMHRGRTIYRDRPVKHRAPPHILNIQCANGSALEMSRIRHSAFYRILRNHLGLCDFFSLERKLRQKLKEDHEILKGKVTELNADNTSPRKKIKIEQPMWEVEELKFNKRQKC